jgi:hypothetical protein
MTQTMLDLWPVPGTHMGTSTEAAPRPVSLVVLMEASAILATGWTTCLVVAQIPQTPLVILAILATSVISTSLTLNP